jgi:hypothetical protein
VQVERMTILVMSYGAFVDPTLTIPPSKWPRKGNLGMFLIPLLADIVVLPLSWILQLQYSSILARLRRDTGQKSFKGNGSFLLCERLALRLF